jgi:hypothetical protein
MRYAVRALGWATKILWILIIVFSVTSVYSAMNVRISFGESQVFLSDETVTMSIPLFINNTGLHDLSDLNITAGVMDYNESLLSTSSTFVPLIQRGSSVEIAHNISLSLGNITSEAQIYLFNDTIFNVNMSTKLIFANAIPFQVSTNSTLPWGAPLYNFSLGQTSYNLLNLTHQELVIPISFENHSPYFGLNGFMQVEILNDNEELLGFSASDLDVPSHSNYDSQVEIVVDVSKITRSGEVHFYFETSAFSFGPIVMPYG